MYFAHFPLEKFQAAFHGKTITLSVINLLDKSDDDWKIIDNLLCPEGKTLIVAHGGYLKLVKRVYHPNGIVEKQQITIEEIAKQITDDDIKNTQIFLLACKSGIYGEYSPAQELAKLLNTKIYAPLEDVQASENGLYYVSNRVIPYDEWTEELYNECNNKWVEFPI